MLGITTDQFRRLMKRLGVEPVGWYRSRSHRHSDNVQCPLWAPEQVQALVGGPEVAEIRERAERRKKGGE